MTTMTMVMVYDDGNDADDDSLVIIGIIITIIYQTR